MAESFSTVLIRLFVLFVSTTFHEFMHAWTANYLGDPTAKSAGRVTLNPIAHIDLFGSIILPLLLVFTGLPAFGWAKPVPINPNNFKNYRVGELLTSLAGPFANLILLLVFVGIYRALPSRESLFGSLILSFVLINAVLLIFNLIPIPPLDGSKVLYSFLPYQLIEKFEMYGPYFLIFFIVFLSPVILWPLVAIFLNFLGVPLSLL